MEVLRRRDHAVELLFGDFAAAGRLQEQQRPFHVPRDIAQQNDVAFVARERRGERRVEQPSAGIDEVKLLNGPGPFPVGSGRGDLARWRTEAGHDSRLALGH